MVRYFYKLLSLDLPRVTLMRLRERVYPLVFIKNVDSVKTALRDRRACSWSSCPWHATLACESVFISCPVCRHLACSLSISSTSQGLVVFIQKLMTSHFLSSYEPELFPGLIYRMIKPRIVLLIFVSGKVVLTGKLKGK